MEVEEPLPDDLRCKRTDGRDWRCKCRVLDGKSYCENHLYRTQRKSPSSPNPNPDPDPNPNPKSTPRIRIRLRVKPEPADGGIEPVIGANQPSPVLENLQKRETEGMPVPENRRCARNNGKDWRCKREVVEGFSLCEIHLSSKLKNKQKQKQTQTQTPLPEKEEFPAVPPENLRCSRNDGRGWRCKGRIVEGGTLCDIHSKKVKIRGGDGPVGEKKSEPSPKKRRVFPPVPENLRCTVVDGRGRCQRQILEGQSLCEIHSKRAENSSKKKKKNVNFMKVKLEPEPEVGPEVDPTEPLKEKEKEKEVVTQNEKENGGETPIGEEEGDEIRCKRTDGRGWRCKKKVMEGKTLCELHYEQGRLRQLKASVPESLKINGVEEGVEKIAKRLKKKKKKKREFEVLENSLDKGKKKRMKADLIRVFLRREIVEKNSGEVTRDLPYGLMAISPAPPTQLRDNAESLGIKIGVQRSKPTVSRKFRSKNIEPPPISSLKVVPYVGNLGKEKNNGRRKCHWCRCSESKTLTKCLTCSKRFFCSDCMKERCADPQEVKLRCPVCRGSCECKLCRKNTKSKDVITKEISKEQYTGSKLQQLQYLINFLLPILVKINQIQSVEAEMEAKFKGQNVSDVDIRQADVGCSDSCCCNNCKSPILDFHRSCPNCSYNLCLNCCQEYTRGGSLTKTRLPALTSSTEPKEDLTASHIHISCPPMELGGCDTSFLDLRCIFPLNWTKELEISATEMVSECDFLQTRDDTAETECLFCAEFSEASKSRELREVCRRNGSDDNFLYCPMIDQTVLAHFQKHWQKGQPVIVHNVLRDSSSLSWNPLAMFYDYLEKAARSESLKQSETVNCLDSYEIEFGVKECFTGLLGTEFTRKRRKTLRLKAKLSSALAHKLFESNYSGIIEALPFQEYTNPRTGLLNLAGKLPEDFPDSKLGPHLCISFGTTEEIARGELVTNLCCNLYDAVDVLVHVGDSSCSTEMIGKIKKLMGNDPKDMEARIVENSESGEARLRIGSCSGPTNANDTDSDASMICSGAGNSSEKPTEQITHQDRIERLKLFDKGHPLDVCGAQCDVFRRQDIPKLMEYILKHVDEFNYSRHIPKRVVHPIFDGSFYLNDTHKLRLKEEFEIEPWTFNQCLGEAVFIPAGCPYQIRNIKSCVNVVVGFVSPENASECIKLMDEIRVLPNDHRAKEQKLEVEKMTICSVDEAIKEMYRLKSEVRSQPAIL